MSIEQESLNGWTNEDEMKLFKHTVVKQLYDEDRVNSVSMDQVMDLCVDVVINDRNMLYDKAMEHNAIIKHNYIGNSDEMASGQETLVQRQLELESSFVNQALNRYNYTQDELVALGRQSSGKTSKSLFHQWFFLLSEAILEKQNLITADDDSDTQASLRAHLLLLDADTYAVILIYELIPLLVHSLSGVSFANAAKHVGRAVEDEISFRNINKKQVLRKNYALKTARGPTELRRRLREQANRLLSSSKWSEATQIRVGAILIDVFAKHAKMRGEDALTGDERAALEHSMEVRDKKTHGMLSLSSEVRKEFLEDNDMGFFSYLGWYPMVVPPVKWTSPTTGGYLSKSTGIMRSKDSSAQKQALQRAHDLGCLGEVYDSLNHLSATKWVINTEILDFVEHVWVERKLSLGKLPSPENVPVPEAPALGEKIDPEDRKRIYREVIKAEKMNREFHSLRCDLKYKLSVASMLRDDVIYFPFNMDFRGRAYPVPPHLNHLGSDVCRALLLFAEKRPVTRKGIYWLKVHLANLQGNDKISFDDRVKWVEERIDLLNDSALEPLDGHRWWLEAEDPWQCLAVCKELHRILNSDCPEEYMTNMPVHQDGSCNGLQHYAALGRDAAGGKAVNLTPSDKPQDVYSEVLKRVIVRVDEAAEKGDEIAKLLQGKLVRKVVKQTVMTSVYGVTLIGAREQIAKRLLERDDIPEDQVFPASMYLAKITLDSLSDLFSSAREIMTWLSNSADLMAMCQQPMSWLTPMGLPVVQPYRNETLLKVKTCMQQVTISDTSELLPVNRSKQSSAFPPNFVHSLDSTHMLKTAIKCNEAGLTFTAVHDSYWTHPSTVDGMNHILREVFVDLHSAPLLDDLRNQFMQRYADVDIPPLPRLGDLDISEVKDAPYFFN